MLSRRARVMNVQEPMTSARSVRVPVQAGARTCRRIHEPSRTSAFGHCGAGQRFEPSRRLGRAESIAVSCQNRPLAKSTGKPFTRKSSSDWDHGWRRRRPVHAARIVLLQCAWRLAAARRISMASISLRNAARSRARASMRRRSCPSACSRPLQAASPAGIASMT